MFIDLLYERVGLFPPYSFIWDYSFFLEPQRKFRAYLNSNKFLKALDQNGMYQRHNLVALASIGKIHKVVVLHCTVAKKISKIKCQL